MRIVVTGNILVLSIPLSLSVCVCVSLCLSLSAREFLQAVLRRNANMLHSAAVSPSSAARATSRTERDRDTQTSTERHRETGTERKTDREGAAAAAGWGQTVAIPRVDASRLTRSEFRQAYVDGQGCPVILTGLSALAESAGGIEGRVELVGHCRVSQCACVRARARVCVCFCVCVCVGVTVLSDFPVVPSQ